MSHRLCIMVIGIKSCQGLVTFYVYNWAFSQNECNNILQIYFYLKDTTSRKTVISVSILQTCLFAIFNGPMFQRKVVRKIASLEQLIPEVTLP